MDGIKIDIDSAAINQAVVQAVIDSSIGDKIQHQIDVVLKEKGGQWNMDNILENAIKAEIKRIVSVLIRDILTEKKDVIRAHIEPLVTEEAIQKMSSKIIEQAFNYD